MSLFSTHPESLASLTIPVLGQTSEYREVTQWDYHSPVTWSAQDWLLVLFFALAGIYVVWLYLRDVRSIVSPYRPLWCAWMTGLRLAVLAGLLLIFLNPHERTETQAYRPSQVAILVDTSASMEQPAEDPRQATAASVPSRIASVRELLESSPLLEELRKTHNVDLYSFDSDLNAVRYRLPTTSVAEGQNPGLTTDTAAVDEPLIDWDELLQTSGQSTRLGDSLDKLLAESRGSAFSGVVVFSDGANNAGRDWQAANQRARETGARIFTVGTGSTNPPVNLEVSRILAASEVQLGDPFDITAIIQSTGLMGERAGPRVFVAELLEQGADDSEPRVVDRADITISEDGTPVSVTFEREPAAAGEWTYGVRVVAGNLIESRDDDNFKDRVITVFDRPLKLLVVAGGPMRDYRFSRNVYFRHKSIDLDIWLQTGSPGISQEANELLFEFPSSVEDLFQYDVLLAFDPDWTEVSQESLAAIERWVSDFGGGIIFVAGDVYTPRLAQFDQQGESEFKPLMNLYPVMLDEVGLHLGAQNESKRAWPVGLTQAGLAAEFLRLTDDPATASEMWEAFEGLYRSYPTRGVKAGTTVYAEFTDPLSRGREGQPVLLASHRYGQGTGVYLGSPETWRLRSLSEEYFERFWIKLVRHAAEGRLKRGQERAVLLLEGRDYEIGQTVPIRARLVDASYEPLKAAAVELDVTGPDGQPILPPPRLLQDRNRPEEYFGTLRVSAPGRYQISLDVAEVQEAVSEEIDVVMPRLEAANPLQDVHFLQNLAQGTGGRYLGLEEALASLPVALPDMGHEFMLDQRVRELWDRQWVMLALGLLLAAEWLTRKLLRLA